MLQHAATRCNTLIAAHIDRLQHERDCIYTGCSSSSFAPTIHTHNDTDRDRDSDRDRDRNRNRDRERDRGRETDLNKSEAIIDTTCSSSSFTLPLALASLFLLARIVAGFRNPVLQRVAACCNKCVAVCCSVLPWLFVFAS